jgi:hypothetical protein
VEAASDAAGTFLVSPTDGTVPGEAAVLPRAVRGGLASILKLRTRDEVRTSREHGLLEVERTVPRGRYELGGQARGGLAVSQGMKAMKRRCEPFHGFHTFNSASLNAAVDQK